MSEIDTDEALLQFQPQTLQVIGQFESFVESQFGLLDLNHDGFLSREELWTALYDGTRSPRELAFLNFLLDRLKIIAASYVEEGEPRPDSISRRDLQEYFAAIKKELEASDDSPVGLWTME